MGSASLMNAKQRSTPIRAFERIAAKSGCRIDATLNARSSFYHD
jgi:hypothetical protein